MTVNFLYGGSVKTVKNSDGFVDFAVNCWVKTCTVVLRVNVNIVTKTELVAWTVTKRVGLVFC